MSYKMYSIVYKKNAHKNSDTDTTSYKMYSIVYKDLNSPWHVRVHDARDDLNTPLGAGKLHCEDVNERA